MLTVASAMARTDSHRIHSWGRDRSVEIFVRSGASCTSAPIAMMLDTLIDASESIAEGERRFLVGELKTLAAELEELTQAVERSSPAHVEPGEYKARNVG